MTTIGDTILGIVIQAGGNLISNAWWILLFIWGVRKLGKDVPKWIEQWERSRMHVITVERAVNMRA